MTSRHERYYRSRRMGHASFACVQGDAVINWFKSNGFGVYNLAYGNGKRFTKRFRDNVVTVYYDLDSDAWTLEVDGDHDELNRDSRGLAKLQALLRTIFPVK